MIGRVVGKYKIRDQIGEGGMGVVYRAEHVMLGSAVAVKVLLPQFTKDPGVLERFFTEAKAASAIQHAGITAVFDFGRVADDQAYIVMELLRGEDLTSFLRRQGKLDPSLAAEIVAQLLAALNAAHVAGVVHRDLKPDNIFLVRDTGAPGGIRVKVLDFGIAKLVGNPQGVKPKTTTKSDTILGTPSYMAPEQCRGGVEIDARADLYAVGCILFELVTGRPPFVAEGQGEIMAMHIYEAPPRLSQFERSLPPELEALISKMLAKSPDDRTPSAAWALAALERVPLPPLGAGEIRLAARDETPIAVPADPAQFPREKLPLWIPIAVIVVALAIAALAIYLIGGSGDEFTPTP
ncbi:MAG: serine/threonine protein kinase [Deltaproteobacteria bacterium]|nr:serine/threonine protein kinase [Deltaproteobacteria bacterium]